MREWWKALIWEKKVVYAGGVILALLNSNEFAYVY